MGFRTSVPSRSHSLSQDMMLSAKESYRIVVVGPFGFGNLGDAAIQQAVLHHLPSLLGNVEINAVSLNPKDTMQRHGVKTFPIGQKWVNVGDSSAIPVHLFIDQLSKLIERTKPETLLRTLVRGIAVPFKEVAHIWGAYKYLRTARCLIFSGGGQIDQFWGGAWEQPYAMMKWSLLAWLAGARILVLSVGVGDISSPLTRWFFRHALLLANYRSFRDQGSRRMVEEQIRLRGGNHVVPDLAYSLNVPMPSHNEITHEGSLTVGVGPLPYCDPRDWAWPEKNAEIYDGYVAKLAEFVRWLVSGGNRVVFYPGDKHDLIVIKDVIDCAIGQGMRPKPGQIMNKPIDTVDGLLATLAQTDVVVASRFHGVLLPHLLNKPVLAISYERKVKTIMSDMGQHRFCVDIHEFDVSSLKELFAQLVAERQLLKVQIQSRIADFRKALDAQYDQVLPFIIEKSVKA